MSSCDDLRECSGCGAIWTTRPRAFCPECRAPCEGDLALPPYVEATSYLPGARPGLRREARRLRPRLARRSGVPDLDDVDGPASRVGVGSSRRAWINRRRIGKTHTQQRPAPVVEPPRAGRCRQGTNCNSSSTLSGTCLEAASFSRTEGPRPPAAEMQGFTTRAHTMDIRNQASATNHSTEDLLVVADNRHRVLERRA